MRERPIPFSAPMVRAILAGQKTQTRRVVKVQPPERTYRVMPYHHPDPRQHFYAWVDSDPPRDICACSDWCQPCPYGQPGDRLWVREAFRFTDVFDADSPSRVGERCVNAGYRKPWAPLHFEADGQRTNWQHTGTPPHDGPPQPGKLRPPMFMPRWASRITLEVTGIRVERLNDISEANAIAEGVTNSLHLPGGRFARENFAHLWWTINGDGSWEANPWVWVVEFRTADIRQN